MAYRILPALVLATVIAAPGAAAAAGGGGGGMMGGMAPSSSAPRYDPAAEYRKGMSAFQAKDFKAASRAFARVTAAERDNADAWYYLGAARAQGNDLKGARKALERSVALEPSRIAAHRDLGVVLARLKQTAAAESELALLKQRAAACQSGCADAGALAEAVSAIEAALAAPTAALSPEPLLLGAAAGDRAYLGAVSLINEKRYEAALTELDRARAAFGPHPDVLTYTGFAWRKLGQHDLAERYYRQALAVAPDHLGALEYYGELKVERGDLGGARDLLARLDASCRFGCAEADELRRWIEQATPGA